MSVFQPRARQAYIFSLFPRHSSKTQISNPHPLSSQSPRLILTIKIRLRTTTKPSSPYPPRRPLLRHQPPPSCFPRRPSRSYRNSNQECHHNPDHLHFLLPSPLCPAIPALNFIFHNRRRAPSPRNRGLRSSLPSPPHALPDYPSRHARARHRGTGN